MIGATGAHRGQPYKIIGTDEFQHPLIVRKMSYHPDMRRTVTSQQGSQLGCLCQAIFFWGRLEQRSSENRTALAHMILEVLCAALDHFERIDIAFIRCVAPCEEAMRAQHDTPDARILI